MKPLILLLLPLFGIIACSGENSTTADQSIRTDYRRYLTQLAAISKLEVQGNEANKKAISTPGANDATYGVALRESIIPKFEEFEHELERIHPTTDEILGLHKILLKRARLLSSAYKGIEKASHNGDQAMIQKANEFFAEANIYYKRWASQMEELTKRYPAAK